MRHGVLLLGLVAAFLTFGLPRWLAGDVASNAADVSKLCREHGGTPSGARAQVCTVRYGRRVYRMDAITPAGFDEDTARYQRQGCAEARREQRASTARQVFIYHPITGVCEHRA
jgi:hypothetical protein